MFLLPVFSLSIFRRTFSFFSFSSFFLLFSNRLEGDHDSTRLSSVEITSMPFPKASHFATSPMGISVDGLLLRGPPSIPSLPEMLLLIILLFRSMDKELFMSFFLFHQGLDLNDPRIMNISTS